MKKQKRYTSDFLLFMPTFLSGAGTVMNLAGNFYNHNNFKTDLESDGAAIENDFNMIGQDLYDIFCKIKKSNPVISQ
jgi:hypothetical protein